MKVISDQTFPKERDLYNIKNRQITNCRFEGVEDGESALKECKNIKVDKCFFDLRYPLWHCKKVKLDNIEQTMNCRAALWYDNKVEINKSKFLGIKVLRESKNIKINETYITSPESLLRCKNINITKSNINGIKAFYESSNINIANCNISSDEALARTNKDKIANSNIAGEYQFFEASNVKLSDSSIKGKYSFQYVNNMTISDCRLETKDAFWHSNNVTVKDSVIVGEYLGWYSNNLTLINCTIVGTQPLCYAKNLHLVNCQTLKCDLAFENSTLRGKNTITGNIESIKNMRRGSIIVDSIGKVIKSKAPFKANGKVKIAKPKAVSKPEENIEENKEVI